MKILLLVIGKTDEDYLITGIKKYVGRIGHYVSFEMKEIPDPRNRKTLSEDQQKKAESFLLLQQLQPGDQVVLLDENGKQFTSVDFSESLEKQMASGAKRLVFIIGGPYGFAQEVSFIGHSPFRKANLTITNNNSAKKTFRNHEDH